MEVFIAVHIMGEMLDFLGRAAGRLVVATDGSGKILFPKMKLLEKLMYGLWNILEWMQ